MISQRWNQRLSGFSASVVTDPTAHVQGPVEVNQAAVQNTEPRVASHYGDTQVTPNFSA